jgi:hypothetical protein
MGLTRVVDTVMLRAKRPEGGAERCRGRDRRTRGTHYAFQPLARRREKTRRRSRAEGQSRPQQRQAGTRLRLGSETDLLSSREPAETLILKVDSETSLDDPA